MRYNVPCRQLTMLFSITIANPVTLAKHIFFIFSSFLQPISMLILSTIEIFHEELTQAKANHVLKRTCFAECRFVLCVELLLQYLLLIFLLQYLPPITAKKLCFSFTTITMINEHASIKELRSFF